MVPFFNAIFMRIHDYANYAGYLLGKISEKFSQETFENKGHLLFLIFNPQYTRTHQ